MTAKHESHTYGRLKSKANWVLIGFLAIAAFFLIAEHRAHILGILPWLLLLACVVLHLFMHGGHGGQQEGSDRSKGERP